MFDFQIADLFCGAGGTSTGALEAAQVAGHRPQLTAINHWDRAIATHTLNHPGARHLCTGVNDVDPRKLYRAGELDLLWASPECTHHSRARGGKPMSDQSRATGHCVVRWAEALQPNIIWVENVPEFLDWGPIGTDGKPLASRKGDTFRAWVGMLESLGYKVEWRVLCAADFGDPTTRQRLFVQAVRGRRKIVWPNRTHAPAHELQNGDLFQSGLKPWVAAREIIDWDLKGRWLDEMPGKAKYGGLPLSPKTLKRIHSGLLKYGLQKRQPYIVSWDHQSGTGLGGIERPLTSVTTKARHGVVEPYLVELKGTAERHLQASAKPLKDPVSTVAASGTHHSLVQPVLIPTFGERPGQAPRTHSIDRPLPTVVGRQTVGLIEPHLLPQQSCGRLRPVQEPVPTVATDGAIALVEPYLIKFYGTAGAASIKQPLDTVTTKERFALVQPLVRVEGQTYRVRLRWRMLQLHELQLAQGFHKTYRFSGNKTEAVKQVGNAVPRRLARALVLASITQNPDLSGYPLD